MEYRLLGRTGVRVSNLCLGTMMFGDWGTRITTEHPHHSPRAGRRRQLRGHCRRAFPGGAGGHRRQGPRGGPGDDVAGEQGPHADGRRAQSAGIPPRIVREVENPLRRLGTDRIDLPRSTATTRTPTLTKPSARSPIGSRRKDPVPRRFDVSGVGDRRGAVDGPGLPPQRFGTEQPPTRFSPGGSKRTSRPPAPGTEWV